METTPLNFIETSPGIFVASRDGKSFWIKTEFDTGLNRQVFAISIYRVTPDPSEKPIFKGTETSLGCAKYKLNAQATLNVPSVSVAVDAEITKEQAFDYLMSHLTSSAVRDGSGRVSFMINGYFNTRKDPVAQFIYDYNNTRKNNLERERELAELARLKTKYEGTK